MVLEVGACVEGKVTGITKFGAFVELEGGKTGMVHISEVAPTYVKEIRDRAFMNCPLENYKFPANIQNIGLRVIDFSETNKTDDAKVVAFSGSKLPSISVGVEAKRLSNGSYREDSLYDVDVVIVPGDCDDYDGSVLDSALPGFQGFIVAIDGGKLDVKECLATSQEALKKLTKTFVFDGETYTIPEADYLLSKNRKKATLRKEVLVYFDGEKTPSVTAAFSEQS